MKSNDQPEHREDDHAWLYEKPAKPVRLDQEVLSTIRSEAATISPLERRLWVISVLLHTGWSIPAIWRIGPDTFVLMAAEVAAMVALGWEMYRQNRSKEI